MKIIKLTTYLLFMILTLAIANQVSAATEFISIVDTDGTSGDYSTLSSWEQYNQCNLLTSRVLSHGGITGTIADDSFVKGATSGAYGTVVHVTSTQIAIETITGTFQNSEQIDKTDTLNGAISSPAANVTSSSAPDSIISVASCQATTGVADQTAVVVEGWTTSAANYIKVYTTEANRHNGVWDGGKYRISYIVGGTGRAIQVVENYVRIEGLQIYVEGADYERSLNGITCLFGSSTSECRIGYNIIRAGVYVKGQGISLPYNSGLTSLSALIYNNIIYDFSSSTAPSCGILSTETDFTVSIYNNTISNCSVGIKQNPGTVTSINNAVFNNTDDFSGTITVTYSASDDTQAGTGNIGWTQESTDWANVFTDYANGDFHLKDFTGTGAIMDQGDDLTAQGFSDDIDSETRSNHSWDIGADEAAEKIYRSVGPSASSALETGTGNDLTISGSTATFTIDLGNDVGVGDAIQYDTAGAAADPIDAICFIHGRTDATHYTVKNSLGGAPTATTADQDWSIFRSYDSLSHAESGDENDAIDNTVETFENWADGKDIVTSNEQWNIACYNGEGDATDETAVTIDGWTTGANNYIKVYTPTETSEVGESQRHSGVWDEGKYRLEVDGSCIDIRENYVTVEGLQLFENDTDTSTYRAGVLLDSTNGVGEWQIYNNIIKCCSTGSYHFGIRSYNTEALQKFYIKNNIIYSGYDGIFFRALITTAFDLYFYNNTVYGAGSYGIAIFRADGDLNIKNNIIVESDQNIIGATDVRISFSGGNVSTDYATNITSDGSAPDNNVNYNVYDEATIPGADEDCVIFKETASASENLHLYSHSYNDAKDAGTDLSSDSNLSFSDDIDGDSRPSPFWDIGADEVAPTTIIKSSLTSTINASQTSKMTDGLVLMQSFDGNHMDWLQPTAEARDQSGQANHGDVIGATATIGKIGQGLEFDGTSEYVNCGNGGSLDIGGDEITVSAWAKIDVDEGGRIVAKHGNLGNYGWVFTRHAANDAVEWRISTTGSDWNGGRTPADTFEIDTWYHLVGIYDGSNMKVFINGISQGYNFPSVLTGNINVATSSTQIGRDANTGNNNIFNGTIDEVRIYNRALFDDEIGDLYRMGRVTFRK